MLEKITSKLIKLKNENEDLRRREFILSVLLLSSIFLFIFANIVELFVFFTSNIERTSNDSVSVITLFLILVFFLILYSLLKNRFFKLSAYIFIGSFFLLAVYMGYTWGVDVNAGLLIYVLVIVMSGILINSNFAFLATAIIAIAIGVTSYLQESNIIHINYYWRSEKWTQTDTIMIIVIFLVIATVSWLSNREIEKSLKRARSSEAELKKERDSLEIKVKERTKELELAQMGRVKELNRLAEFGRLSYGAFHDMTNLTSALALNIEMIQNHEINNFDSMKPYLDRANVTTRQICDFIDSIRKQIAGQQTRVNFSINKEIKQVLQIFSYKALSANIKMEFKPGKDIKIVGDPIKFNQIMTNLISNAVDAYEKTNKSERKIEIKSGLEDNFIVITVEDWGTGIPEEKKEKIFEPFFTTKEFSKGTGIGLSVTKEIIEENFGGKIDLESRENEFTKFIIKLPKK